ncbi:MAG: hypothetical protein KKF62_17410 [Bacteroidetes bacterium]|nr:hypothetical protein [Bacteroidota bacterium]MBU1797928.1 hypothetical protein [Bacteroidota bacterium]
MVNKKSNFFIKQLAISTSIFVLLFNVMLFAQRNNPPGEWNRMHGKIEQLEKIKIIELLNLDEATTLKFFSRRDEHLDSQRALIDKRDLLYDKLNESFKLKDEIDYKQRIAEIFAIEKEMLAQREKFFNSLKDILSEKQIAELIVFESNFRNEIRHQFIKQGERRKPYN